MSSKKIVRNFLVTYCSLVLISSNLHSLDNPLVLSGGTFTLTANETLDPFHEVFGSKTLGCNSLFLFTNNIVFISTLSPITMSTKVQLGWL